jgi:hypothetical protein
MAERSARHMLKRGQQQGSATMMNMGYGGVLGVLILVGDIWAILNIFQSSVSNEKK